MEKFAGIQNIRNFTSSFLPIVISFPFDFMFVYQTKRQLRRPSVGLKVVFYIMPRYISDSVNSAVREFLIGLT
jgi:hypothetical protein